MFTKNESYRFGGLVFGKEKYHPNWSTKWRDKKGARAKNSSASTDYLQRIDRVGLPAIESTKGGV